MIRVASQLDSASRKGIIKVCIALKCSGLPGGDVITPRPKKDINSNAARG